ncbi:MAG TPA: cytidylate kinase-like family protein [Candidatus Methylacidiphilales bacterium]
MHTSLEPLITFLKAEASHRTAALYDVNPVVTLSREEGSGGEEIARKAAELLTARTHGKREWLVLDDLFAEAIVRDHRLPRRIRSFLTEEETSQVENVIEELLGLHPDRHVLVEKMIETILHLAKIGNVIFVGRASHIVLMGVPEARHVRIVGELDHRAERLTALTGLSLDEARDRARRIDKARMKFIGHYFHRDIRDPHGYDMVLNTDRLSVNEAAHLVAEAVPNPSPVLRRNATVIL